MRTGPHAGGRGPRAPGHQCARRLCQPPHHDRPSRHLPLPTRSPASLAADQTRFVERPAYSPRPGRIGASAILGHADSRRGPAVFFRLTDLCPGDEIHVDGADGQTVTFAVRAVEQHPKASFPSEKVFGATPTPTLRLITCGGAFDSDAGSHLDNVIVFADPVATT